MRSWGTSDSTGSSFRGRPPRPNGSYGGNGLLGHGLLGQQVQGTARAYLARDAHRDAIVGCAQGCDRGMRTGMRVGRHLLLDVDAVFDPIADLMNCGAADLSPVTLGTGLLTFAT